MFVLLNVCFINAWDFLVLRASLNHTLDLKWVKMVLRHTLDLKWVKMVLRHTLDLKCVKMVLRHTLDLKLKWVKILWELHLFFPGQQAFCKKAVERVRIEKNIMNSSVEWSGVVFFRKSHMYAHHQIRLNELINMMYFIFNLNAYFSRNWRKCS